MVLPHAAGLLVVATVATLGTACGSDKNAPTPSKPTYVKHADALCKRGNNALHAAQAKLFAGVSNPSAKQERKYVTEVFVPNLEHQVAQLRRLTPPKGDEDEVKAVFDAAAAGLAELKAKPPSSFDTPPAGFAKAKTLATQYGFKICGSS